MPNGQKMTGESHSDADDFIYNTPQESLKSTMRLNTTPSNVKLKSIQQLVQESETTQTTSNETYVDPVDDAMDNDSLHQVHHHQAHHRLVHHQVVVEVVMEDINGKRK